MKSIYKLFDQSHFDELEEVFEKCISDNPNEMLFRIQYALYLQSSPPEQIEYALDVLGFIIDKKSDYYCEALLLNAYWQNDRDSLDKEMSRIRFIDRLKNETRPAYRSALRIAIAWTWENVNESNYCESLRSAIEEYSSCAGAHELLSRYFLKRGDTRLAFEHIDNAIAICGQRLKTTMDDIDHFSFENFLKEFYLEENISYVYFESLKEYRDELK